MSSPAVKARGGGTVTHLKAPRKTGGGEPDRFIPGHHADAFVNATGTGELSPRSECAIVVPSRVTLLNQAWWRQCMGVQVLRRRFTTNEYHRMGESGILSEDDRVELIAGEIVEMTPIGSRHQACVDRLNELLMRQTAQRAVIRVQGPVRLDEHSEPQPDLVLLHRRPDFYATSHPDPQDVLLLIEVADTSADYDREIKLPLYSRHGILEVWLVDLAREHVEVFRKPSTSGYQDFQVMQRGHHLVPQSLPDLEVAVEDILG
jgi:Uma2 family endonuclease